jgi:hypothetical protein
MLDVPSLLLTYADKPRRFLWQPRTEMAVRLWFAELATTICESDVVAGEQW